MKPNEQVRLLAVSVDDHEKSKQLVEKIAADGKLTVLETRVVPPFGTDHVIAVTTPTDPVDLRALLRSLDGRRGSVTLSGAIRTVLREARGAGSLSIAELYSGVLVRLGGGAPRRRQWTKCSSRGCSSLRSWVARSTRWRVEDRFSRFRR